MTTPIRIHQGQVSNKVHPLSHHSQFICPESLTKQTIADVADVMLAAGCNSARDDLSSKIASQFEEKITSLVRLAGSLQVMLENASDFKVFIAQSGGKFDSAEFEDENAEDTEGVITQGGLVLCATSIGLIKQVLPGVGQKEKVMVLKAKVLLESFLDSLHPDGPS